MKRNFLILGILTALALIGCENNVTLSPKASRFIASEHLQKLNGKENLPAGVKELLNEEQNLHNKDLWGAGAFASNINPDYVPEKKSQISTSLLFDTN